jgi:hypothetical protein
LKGWDEGGGWNDDDWNFDDIEKPKSNNVKPAATTTTKPNNTKPNTSQAKDPWGTTNTKSAWDLNDDVKNVDYNTFNLNKLSDWELEKHKAIMEKKFEKN